MPKIIAQKSSDEVAETDVDGFRTFVVVGYNCQARVQSPNRKPTKSLKEEKKKGF